HKPAPKNPPAPPPPVPPSPPPRPSLPASDAEMGTSSDFCRQRATTPGFCFFGTNLRTQPPARSGKSRHPKKQTLGAPGVVAVNLRGSRMRNQVVVGVLAVAWSLLATTASAQDKPAKGVITLAEVTIVGRIQKPIASVDVNRIQPKLTLQEL